MKPGAVVVVSDIDVKALMCSPAEDPPLVVCDEWPDNDAYDCSGGEDWQQLSGSVDESNCRQLCQMQQTETEPFCCFVGATYGCWMKPGAVVVVSDIDVKALMCSPAEHCLDLLGALSG